ncbi:type II toxin-antitoxin system HicA family toxin [Companilactobacillus halodurans]|uniref:Type II toxin-antitoxin system HicA family toxin n=1 Tax=Companilactobacillus halodurans TaxID=2584183 RepID=A0A5P0ZUE7_9LACO|nr:type II toxin-antitoxin system HicA family toxin [Companilactobacillus halodurans]MQS76262.1 type II toxin-antitoxin system HicA family toxin [Companilactobacillus halodurans]MQS96610.1 type II toxin-antitoxin system HicA family toxin [Companilactobacillus halodurans]
MPMKPRELIRVLMQNGFIEKSQRGSHLKMYNPFTNVTVLIPIHAREMKKGTENAILKQAGLK